MAMIRPSLTLVLDLDERAATEETVLEIKRSYAHITTPVIRTHAAEAEAPVSNVARLLVNMGAYHYLHSADEGADERWESIVEPWIGNILHKVGNNMKVFNDRQREVKMPELMFDRACIELQGGQLVVALHPDPVCWIDPALNAQVGLARTLLNDGTLEDAVRVSMPTQASWEEQREQAWDAWIVEHPEALEQPEPEPEPEVPEEPQPQKTKEELLREDIEAKSYENTAVPITDSDALPRHPALRDPEPEEEEPEQFSFAVDYSLWEVEFADGSKRVFNAAERSFAGDAAAQAE